VKTEGREANARRAGERPGRGGAWPQGGKARADTKSAEKRSEIAKQAGAEAVPEGSGAG